MATLAHEVSSPAAANATASVARPVHVLFLIDQLCGVGGAESALLDMTRNLPRDRFRCSVMTFRLDPQLALVKQFPCPITVLPLRRTYGWNAVKLGFRLSQFMREQQVDIVHTFFPSADLWGGVVAKLSGKKVLISSRRDMGILRKPFHHAAYRLLSPMYDHVLAVSGEVRQHCIDKDRVAARKVSTTYNPVDATRFGAQLSMETGRELLGFHGASHVIATVSNIRRVKGLDVFLKAAAAVRQEFPCALFVVAGTDDPNDAGYRRELEAMIADAHLHPNFKFLGFQHDVVPLLRASNVFCLLSRSEGFSNALAQAMACGVPCVATRVGGNAEALQNGRGGLLVASEDFQSAAESIASLLRHPERARGLAECSQQFARTHLSMDQAMARLVDLYDSLLQTKVLAGA